MKRKAERGTKLLNIFKSIFFITFVINIFLFAYKHESQVEHSNYKVLVQESEGSSNYVEYSGISFPKSGYVLAGSTCKNGGVITQTAAKTLSFTGGVDECTLKFDIAGETYTENSLYGVIANEYNNGGLAGKYTGDHADAYDRSGTEDIYYFTTPIEDDETQGNELLDKWNVIFGGFCWQMFRTTDTGGVKMIYNGVPSNGTCNNTGEAQQIGTSAFNSSNNSPAYVGYMYNTVYEYSSQTAGAYKYGNSFTYSNGAYTLTDTITTSSNATVSDLNNHHYTCFNTSGTCSSICYIYYLSSSTAKYIVLSNGKSVENALNEMLSNSNVNTNNSTIKTYIDNWYQNNLSSYTSYLEDSVFCNDRSIRSLNGWNPNGGSVNSVIQFKEYTSTSDLSCTNDTDRFSTLNNSARLTYPIGLASNPEMNLLNNSTSRNTGQYYWLGSPSHLSSSNAYVRVVNTDGNLAGYVVYLRGARPVISLKPGTEYASGDGSKNNPYIVETNS